MINRQEIHFRIASEAWEFEQIHRLNYHTFVEEIPQHRPNLERRLVDKFHSENTYGIAVRELQTIGMLAWRARRPFSLDGKLQSLDSYLPAGRSLCEIRLLAVRKEFRRGLIFRGLLSLLADHFSKSGYDLGLISGALSQRKLYQHLGFVPFGPVLGAGAALFQPMYLSLEEFMERAENGSKRWICPGIIVGARSSSYRGAMGSSLKG